MRRKRYRALLCERDSARHCRDLLIQESSALSFLHENVIRLDMFQTRRLHPKIKHKVFVYDMETALEEGSNGLFGHYSFYKTMFQNPRDGTLQNSYHVLI